MGPPRPRSSRPQRENQGKKPFAVPRYEPIRILRKLWQGTEPNRMTRIALNARRCVPKQWRGEAARLVWAKRCQLQRAARRSPTACSPSVRACGARLRRTARRTGGSQPVPAGQHSPAPNSARNAQRSAHVMTHRPTHALCQGPCLRLVPVCDLIPDDNDPPGLCPHCGGETCNSPFCLAGAQAKAAGDWRGLQPEAQRRALAWTPSGGLVLRPATGTTPCP